MRMPAKVAPTIAVLLAFVSFVVLFAIGGCYAVKVALAVGCGMGLFAAGFVVEKIRWNAWPIVAGAFFGATIAILGVLGIGQISAELLNQPRTHWKFTPVDVRTAMETIETSAILGAFLGIGAGFAFAWLLHRRSPRPHDSDGYSERTRKSRIGSIFAGAAVLVLLLSFALAWDGDPRAFVVLIMALVLLVLSVAVWLAHKLRSHPKQDM